MRAYKLLPTKVIQSDLVIIKLSCRWQVNCSALPQKIFSKKIQSTKRQKKDKIGNKMFINRSQFNCACVWIMVKKISGYSWGNKNQQKYLLCISRVSTKIIFLPLSRRRRKKKQMVLSSAIEITVCDRENILFFSHNMFWDKKICVEWKGKREGCGRKKFFLHTDLHWVSMSWWGLCIHKIHKRNKSRTATLFAVLKCVVKFTMACCVRKIGHSLWIS